MSKVAKTLFSKLFSSLQTGGMTATFADGDTKVFGNPVEAKKLHLVFNDWQALKQIIRQPSIAMGEGYARGEITFKAGGFEELIHLMEHNQARFSKWFDNPIAYGLQRATNGKRIQRRNISHHYDVGNDFYALWLDKTMTYSCAYFKKPADTLEQAQEQKVEHLLRKLYIKNGQHILDIGSGWGTLLITAAKKYGISGLGITLSSEQLKYATEAAKNQKVDHLVTFKLMNYQDLAKTDQKFDRIISVGMFEHVGLAGIKTFFDAVKTLLKDDGVSVLHTITTARPHGGTDAWIDKYIFPGGRIPAQTEILAQLAKDKFVMTDYEDLRIHYGLTLDAWHDRYVKHKKDIVAKHGEFFYRTWDMYLATCAANFRAGGLNLSQLVFTKWAKNDLPLTRDYMYSSENTNKK